MARPARPRRSPDEIAKPGTAPVVSGALTIDRVVHERMRLAMVGALALNESLAFADLKDLIVHARRLEDAGYITCTKTTDGHASRTVYRLTAAGRAALRRYLERMRQLGDALKETDSQIRNADRGVRPSTGSGRP
jgi:hypothetical protein